MKKKQQKSKYSDWISVNAWDDPEKGTTFSYNGWSAVAELPEWKQDQNGIVDGPKQYIFAATKRWMAPFGDPHEGIDGWRLDVAFCVKHPFWKEWRTWVKGINPEAYLTAEVIDVTEKIKPFLQGDEFDAVMNYNFAFTCADYFINQDKRISTTEFDCQLRDLRNAFDAEVAYVQQNLLDSHDSSRVGSHIVNADQVSYRDWSDYHRYSKASNPQYSVRKPTPAERDIQKLMALFQMTYVGAPMLYYGDEVGMWGANDPCCRKPMIWEDKVYDDEVYLPDGSRRKTPDNVEVDHDLFSVYRTLIHIRHQNPALSLGDFQTLLVDDERELYAFSRRYKGEILVIVLNNRRTPQAATIPFQERARLQDLLAPERIYSVEAGHLSLELRPLWGAILTAIQS